MSDQTTLNWTLLNEDGRDVQALTELGTYTISVDSDIAGGTHYLWVAGQTEEDEHHSVYRCMREAKAAAELDYSQRRRTTPLTEDYREPGEFGEGATVRRAEPARVPAAYLVEKLDGTKRSIIDGLKYDPRKPEFWLNAEVQATYRVVPLYAEAEAVLRKIAAYDDAAANAYLRATGSYRCFDEPRAVEMARVVLEGKPCGA